MTVARPPLELNIKHRSYTGKKPVSGVRDHTTALATTAYDGTYMEYEPAPFAQLGEVVKTAAERRSKGEQALAPPV